MRTSGNANDAASLAITKSHHVTSVSPYPRQYPLTAAMTGLKISQPLSNELIVGFSQNVPGKSPAEPPPSRRSAPAQKALPAPVTIAIHASSSSRNRLNASFRSRRISPLIAFNASGRL
jgi:hypothetical protein